MRDPASTIVARAEADVEYRRLVVADLEAALAAEGVEPEPRIVAELRSLGVDERPTSACAAGPHRR